MRKGPIPAINKVCTLSGVCWVTGNKQVMEDRSITIFTDIQFLQVDQTSNGWRNVGHFIVAKAQLPDTMATE